MYDNTPTTIEQRSEQHKPSAAQSLLRACTACSSPMLLMSAEPEKPGLITKLYQCYICEKTEEILTAVNYSHPHIRFRLR